MKKLKSLLVISAILFCVMFCTISANAQGVGGKAGTGGKGGFGGGQASSSFVPTYVTSCVGANGSFSNAVTCGVTAGQFAVIGIGSTSLGAGQGGTGTNNNLTVTDTNGDIFTGPTGNQYVYSGGAIGALWFATIGTTNASEVFTCANTNATFYNSCIVVIYSGTPTVGWDVAIPAPTSGNNAAPSCSSTVSSGTSSTTANANELGVGIFITVSPNGVGIASFTQVGSWVPRIYNTTDVGAIAFVYVDNVLSSTQTLTAQVALGTCSNASAGTAGLVSSVK